MKMYKVRYTLHWTTVDDVLAQLTGGKIFSLLHANSDFWQVPLEQSSRLLTGVIALTRCPSGYVYSTPKNFKGQMKKILMFLSKGCYVTWMMF